MRFAVLIACLLVMPSLWGSDDAWLKFEQGKKAYRSKEFGEALILFKQAAARKDPYPEAEYWIGLVFLEEGESSLAEKQFLKAVDRREYLESSEEVYEIQYELADLYRLTGRLKLMENMYLQMLEERAAEIAALREKMISAVSPLAIAAGSVVTSPAASKEAGSSLPPSRNEFQRDALVRVISNEGLDKALLLFRLPDPVILKANTDLGYFYYQSGRTGDAIEQYALAVNTIFSVGIESVMEKKLDFDYTTAQAALGEMLAVPDIAAYCRNEELFKQLYFLGCSLYFDGKRSVGRSIWSLVKATAAAGAYAAKATEQLERPTKEFMNY